MTVAIIATGGTIANTQSGRVPIATVLDDIARHAEPVDRATLAGIEVVEALRIGADEVGLRDWHTLHTAVSEHLRRPEVDGVVVTHGTYTLEETAFFLHLTLRHAKPVVVTCSQRRHGTSGNDGDRNLLDALRVARDPAVVGAGVMIMEAGLIHSARDVVKTSQHPGGFWSPHGPIGSVEEDAVTLRYRPARDHTIRSKLVAPPSPDLWSRVDVVAAHVDADGVAIDAFVTAGTRGLIVDGFSYRGLPAPAQREALGRAVDKGIAVVLCNRGRVGRVPTDPHSPFIGGDDLSAAKARILAALALSAGVPVSDLGGIFARY